MKVELILYEFMGQGSSTTSRKIADISLDGDKYDLGKLIKLLTYDFPDNNQDKRWRVE